MTESSRILGTAFVIAVALVGLMLLYTRRRGLLDVPNHRSSHVVPTPRGGGIGLVAALLLAAALWLPRAEGARLLPAGAVALVLCYIGWRDDRGGVGIGPRFTVHVLCGVVLAFLVRSGAPDFWPPGRSGIAIWCALWLFWTVASINMVNFMDGIDGLVASQAAVFAAGTLLLLSDQTAGSVVALTLLGSAAGFLVWNWAPARIFLGDSGSGPLGLFVSVAGALAAVERPTGALVFLPLFFLYLDSLLTMLRRRRRGERITEAHRSHLYQRLTRVGWSHAQVSAMYAGAAVPGAILGATAHRLPMPLAAGAVALYALLLVAAWHALDVRAPDGSLPGARPG